MLENTSDETLILPRRHAESWGRGPDQDLRDLHPRAGGRGHAGLGLAGRRGQPPGLQHLQQLPSAGVW